MSPDSATDPSAADERPANRRALARPLLVWLVFRCLRADCLPIWCGYLFLFWFLIPLYPPGGGFEKVPLGLDFSRIIPGIRFMRVHILIAALLCASGGDFAPKGRSGLAPARTQAENASANGVTDYIDLYPDTYVTASHPVPGLSSLEKYRGESGLAGARAEAPGRRHHGRSRAGVVVLPVRQVVQGKSHFLWRLWQTVGPAKPQLAAADLVCGRTYTVCSPTRRSLAQEGRPTMAGASTTALTEATRPWKGQGQGERGAKRARQTAACCDGAQSGCAAAGASSASADLAKEAGRGAERRCRLTALQRESTARCSHGSAGHDEWPARGCSRSTRRRTPAALPRISTRPWRTKQKPGRNWRR